MQRRSFTLVLILFLISFGLNAQNKIQGIVYDLKTNEKLPYVNLFWINTQKGTSTDIGGKFSLNTIPKNNKLVISYIGYYNDTIDISNTAKDLKIHLR